MNYDNIIRMAREAGFYSNPDVAKFEHFAALVAAAERDANLQQIEIIVEAAVAAEREACSKVCEEDGLLWGKKYAAAIRARSVNNGT